MNQYKALGKSHNAERGKKEKPELIGPDSLSQTPSCTLPASVSSCRAPCSINRRFRPFYRMNLIREKTRVLGPVIGEKSDQRKQNSCYGDTNQNEGYAPAKHGDEVLHERHHKKGRSPS